MSAPDFSKRARHSFVLLEAMLGVAIFALGVIALGQSVNNCMAAEQARTDAARARLALRNAVAELEAGRVVLDDEKPVETELEGMFAGMKLREVAAPPNGKVLVNELDQPLNEVREIQVEVNWQASGQPQSASVNFYQLKRSPRGPRITNVLSAAPAPPVTAGDLTE